MTVKRILGIAFGLVLASLAFIASQNASGGWEMGFTDVGVWWTVITFFLTVASLSAIIGTVIHSRQEA